MANFNVSTNLFPLPLENTPFNRQIVLTSAIIAAAALAAGTANADTLTFRATVPAGSIVRNVTLVVPTNKGLQNSADAAFNDITASVGDSVSNLNHIPARQVALQGTEIKIAGADNAIAALPAATPTSAEVIAIRNACATLTGRTYAASDFVTVLLTPMAGKNLKDLTPGGELDIVFSLINEQTLGFVR